MFCLGKGKTQFFNNMNRSIIPNFYHGNNAFEVVVIKPKADQGTPGFGSKAIAPVWMGNVKPHGGILCYDLTVWAIVRI